MIHPAFDICVAEKEQIPSTGRLLIEVSSQTLNYILFTPQPWKLYSLRQYRIYTTADRSATDLISEIIECDEILQRYRQNVSIIYNFSASELLPQVYRGSVKNKDLMNVISGHTESDSIFEDPVERYQAINIYAVPTAIGEVMQEKFSTGIHRHIYSVILQLEDRADEQVLYLNRLVFYNDKFISSCFRRGQLQLIQTFSYQTPEDAAYYLLLICKQFEIPPHEMTLHAAGLIDSQSSLSTELMKYFADVRFESLPTAYNVNGLLDEYPSHYFSPLLNMTLCEL